VSKETAKVSLLRSCCVVAPHLVRDPLALGRRVPARRADTYTFSSSNVIHGLGLLSVAALPSSGIGLQEAAIDGTFAVDGLVETAVDRGSARRRGSRAPWRCRARRA
jgi:hypothetical protein